MRRGIWLVAALTVGCSSPSGPVTSAATTPAAEASSTKPASTAIPPTPSEMAAKCDVPLYPGSTTPDGMSSIGDRPDGSKRYELVMATTDSPAKAGDFYANAMKVPKAMKVPSLPNGDLQTVVGKSPKGNDVIITVGPEGGRTLIRVKAIVYAR